jgi:hypothetical protein
VSDLQRAVWVCGDARYAVFPAYHDDSRVGTQVAYPLVVEIDYFAHGGFLLSLWIWCHRIGQTMYEIAVREISLEKMKSRMNGGSGSSLSQHSSGYLVTRRIPRHGAFARYERIFSWRVLCLFVLPRWCWWTDIFLVLCYAGNRNNVFTVRAFEIHFDLLRVII